MSNLTLALDDDLLRAARIKAVQQGTSVNEICRQAIARFAAPANAPDDFLAELQAVAARVRKSAASRAPAEPMWTSREAMYEEGMAERMPTLWASFERAPKATPPGLAASATATRRRPKPKPKPKPKA